jgi:predicted TPR repeat methyltransferase
MLNDILRSLVSKLPSTNPRAVEKEVLRVADGRRAMLDVGCCGGSLGKRFVKKGFEVTGIDWDLEYLQEAKQNGYFDVIQTDLKKSLNIEDNAFPIVLATEIIEHMPDDHLVQMVSELHRICEGYMIATVPNCNHPIQKILHDYMFDRGHIKNLGMGYHYQRFNKHSFEQLLTNAGFEIEKSKLILCGTDIMITAMK